MVQLAFLPILLVSSAAALDVPANLKSFYDGLKSKGDCSNKLATGFYSSAKSSGDTSYCGDHLDDYGIIYMQGPSGQFANMDVDCDGSQAGKGSETRCGGSTTTQSHTSARSAILGYDVGIEDLSPYNHSYVVFGNSGSGDGNTFDPQTKGVKMASIMAVLCGDQMFYGVWGDVNGGDSAQPSVGEASLSLATACYGDKMAATGDDSSHDANDVLYIAFTGTDAVPGADRADWMGDFDSFHTSLVEQGNKLVGRIGSSSASASGSAATAVKTSEPATTSAACGWEGHCEGDSCSVAQDCWSTMKCLSGSCGYA